MSHSASPRPRPLRTPASRHSEDPPPAAPLSKRAAAGLPPLPSGDLSDAPALPPRGPYSGPDPIEHLIPTGALCTLSGASGVGKTAFLASLVAALQKGEPVLGHQTHTPPAIGVLACDRPWRDHAAWFAKAGCAPFTSLSLRDIDYNWKVLRDVDSVAETFGTLIDEMHLPPGSFLIADPVSLFIPGNLIDYKTTAIGMGQIDQQLKPRQITLLGVCHTSKQKAGGNDRYLRPQDRILGSTALLGYSETAFYLLAPEEAQKPHYEFGYVCHQLPPAAFAYKRNTDNGLFISTEFLDLVADEEAALSLLSENPDVTCARSVWFSKIERTVACNAQIAEAIVKRLMRAGRVEKAGRGLFRRTKVH